jgi:OmcA/MtrC family decaheme c-type cytochrome
VVAPDPNNIWLVPSGGNATTNASYVAASGFVPAGADIITYDVKSVDAVPDATISPSRRPQITFKLKRNGTDVIFQTYVPGVTTEMMPDFTGSPSVYFAFAVPQDGIGNPADFNATVSGYLKKIWNGTATGQGAGTLTGPDGSGYYTIKLTGVQVPSTATMFTGGVGYTYDLSTTPPLVQTNLPAYPWVPNIPLDGKAQGGLSVPPPNVWKTATGFTGRRAIVDNAKCQACHGALGVAPTFHAGQANDGPSCSFCHGSNLTRAGWSVGSSYYVHAIHARRKRALAYTWQAANADPSYDEVAFPGTVTTCASCHLADTFDYGSTESLASVASRQLATVATGIYSVDPLVNSTTFTTSPYVVADGITTYGSGFSFNAATGVTTQAAGTTLVLSAVTGACASCHDSAVAIEHMQASGGQYYVSRATALAASTAQEQCLICHGPGRVAAISAVHQR